MTELPVPPELGRLSALIDSHVECLAGSDSDLRSIALCASKYIFDWSLQTEKSSKPHLEALLATLTDTAPPQTRSRARSASTQQWRSPSPIHKRPKKINIRETPLPSLFVETMSIDQIWQQLDLRAARVCENLQALQGEDEDENADSHEEDGDNDASEDGDDDVEMDGDDDDDDDEEGLSEVHSGDEEEDGSAVEGVIDLQDEASEDGDEDEDQSPSTSIWDAVRGNQISSQSKPHARRDSDLDDGFFDLATFNAETSKLEGKEISRGKSDLSTDEDSAAESEVDLFCSVDDIETEGAVGGLDLFYADFFEPPTRTRMQSKNLKPSRVRFHEQVSVKKIKAVGRGMPVSSMVDKDTDEEEEDLDD